MLRKGETILFIFLVCVIYDFFFQEKTDKSVEKETASIEKQDEATTLSSENLDEASTPSNEEVEEATTSSYVPTTCHTLGTLFFKKNIICFLLYKFL